MFSIFSKVGFLTNHKLLKIKILIFLQIFIDFQINIP